MVAYLIRGDRLGRLAEAGSRLVRRAGRFVWTHTNVVLYTAICISVAVNYWQSEQIGSEIAQTRAALCFARADLNQRFAANEFKIRHATELGIPRAVIAQLQLALAGQRATILSLRRIKCS